MQFTVSAIYDNVEFLEKILTRYPKARIARILSHEQRKGFHLVVNQDNSEYVDDFGLEIYQAQEVDWEGELADIDERFEGALPF